MTPAEQVKEKVCALEALLLERSPRMPVLLREIHTALKADPDVVTLLTEEEISVIVQGLSRQTQTELISSLTKSSLAKKSTKKLDLDDL